MKKTYAKPLIVFESFELATNIAATCPVVTRLQAYGGCGYGATKDEEIFVSGVCRYTPPANYDTVCYDVPTEYTKLFNSY